LAWFHALRRFGGKPSSAGTATPATRAESLSYQTSSKGLMVLGRATAEVLTHALDNRFEAPGQQRVGRLDHLFQLSTARPAPPG
jgi:hypothetical protein